MAEESTSHPVEHPEHAATEGNVSAAVSHLQTGARQAIQESGLDREGPSIATAALVGVGVALLEPELIPGILIGAGAVLAPKVLPSLGGLLRPLVKGIVKAGYSAGTAVREMAAEAQEQVEDIMAEARAEQEAGRAPETAQQPSPEQRPKKQQTRQVRPTPAANL